MTKVFFFQIYLGHGANVRIKGGSENETPLHMACRLGEARGEKCVRMLLKSGANPNLPLSDGKIAKFIRSAKVSKAYFSIEILT